MQSFCDPPICCKMLAHRIKANFADSCQKSVTLATSLDDHKKGRIGCPAICTYNENLVKISPVHSQIIGL